MSVKTLQSEKNLIYFCTFTCYNWLKLFEITNYYTNIYKWFDILENYGNKLIGYVIMPNHIHFFTEYIHSSAKYYETGVQGIYPVMHYKDAFESFFNPQSPLRETLRGSN